MYRGNPPSKTQEKKSASRQIQSCWAPKKLSNIRNTYLHFFSFIVFQELNRISQISAENDFIIIIFFNNISIHSKVTSGYFAALLGLRIYNIKLLYTFRSIRTREEKLLKCKNSCFILPVFHLIISFLQLCGSWWSLSLGYLWLVSVSFFGFFFNNVNNMNICKEISWPSGNLRIRTTRWFSEFVISKFKKNEIRILFFLR